MSSYTDKAAAIADGFTIVHEPERHRFALYRSNTVVKSGVPERELVGEAHYRLDDDHTINFDHTVIIPELRGTGLSALLARHALTSELMSERTVQASCWFIAKYIAQHPELLKPRDSEA